jgi:hypothetical protein
MPDPQRCLSAPEVPAPPPLPFPLSAAPPKIAITFNPAFCCKLPTIPVKSPFDKPLKIDPAVLNPVLTVIKNARAQINVFLGKLQVRCPRE